MFSMTSSWGFFRATVTCSASGCSEFLVTEHSGLMEHIAEREECGWRRSNTKPVLWFCALHAHLAPLQRQEYDPFPT